MDLPLEDDHVLAVELAPPRLGGGRGTGVAFGEEIIGGRADF